MKKIFLLLFLFGINSYSLDKKMEEKQHFHVSSDTTIDELLKNKYLKGFEQFILPMNTYYSKKIKLENINKLLPYHSNIKSETTVESINYMIDEINKGKKIFYNFYTEKEKIKNLSKEETGLFFFRGKPGAPFAVICPGGGFSYVGSIHEGFPYAIKLSQEGYNAFVIHYRVGNGYEAVEDLVAALSFIFQNAEELKIDTKNYSLWGSSAGARMAAAIGSYGTSAFGEKDLPKPAVIIMAYTGQSSFTENDSPTFAVVGDKDRIANPDVVERRIENLKKAGVDTEFYKYKNIGHGFGIGKGTTAEGWIDKAISFWEKMLNEY